MQDDEWGDLTRLHVMCDFKNKLPKVRKLGFTHQIIALRKDLIRPYNIILYFKNLLLKTKKIVPNHNKST